MRLVRPLLLATLLGASAASAQGPSIARNHDSNAPIDWTADQIEVQDRANRAIFTGNVHVVQGDMTIDAARMTMLYTKPPAGTQGDPQVQRLDASGNVVVTGPGERAKGSFGIYDFNRRIITLIGNVSLTRNGNTVNGARAIMDLNSGRSTVDGSAVGGAGGSASKGGRVTGRFTVPQKSQSSPPPPAPAATTPR